MKKVSFIAPCYNEELVINEYYRRVSAVAEKHPGYDFEFIIVNDGSKDNSAEILNRLADSDKRVKVLHFAANQGHQTALFAGIEHAHGDINIALDIDLQDPPELFEVFAEKIEAGFDVVHAQRSKRVKESWFKLITARIFYKLLRFTANIELIENCADFRAFSKPARETICTFREKHKFLRGMFVLIGFRQTIIQYERDARFDGETKYTLSKMISLAFDAVFSFSQFPIRLILLVSMSMWGISFIYLLWVIVSYFFYQSTVSGWASIVFLQIFFTGLILFFLAVIGSYIGRIYEQGQNRPPYWLISSRNLDNEKNF